MTRGVVVVVRVRGQHHRLKPMALRAGVCSSKPAKRAPRDCRVSTDDDSYETTPYRDLPRLAVYPPRRAALWQGPSRVQGAEHSRRTSSDPRSAVTSPVAHMIMKTMIHGINCVNLRRLVRELSRVTISGLRSLARLQFT